MKHKYLEEAGIKEYADNTWGCPFDSPDEREPEFLGKREERGVDPRATWALDTHIMQYLYECICAYEEDASSIVDLTFHKFTYKRKKYNQLEMIHLLKNYLLKYLKAEEEDPMKEDELKQECSKEIFNILLKILPAMWW